MHLLLHCMPYKLYLGISPVSLQGLIWSLDYTGEIVYTAQTLSYFLSQMAFQEKYDVSTLRSSLVMFRKQVFRFALKSVCFYWCIRTETVLNRLCVASNRSWMFDVYNRCKNTHVCREWVYICQQRSVCVYSKRKLWKPRKSGCLHMWMVTYVFIIIITLILQEFLAFF